MLWIHGAEGTDFFSSYARNLGGNLCLDVADARNQSSEFRRILDGFFQLPKGKKSWGKSLIKYGRGPEINQFYYNL